MNEASFTSSEATSADVKREARYSNAVQEISKIPRLIEEKRILSKSIQSVEEISDEPGLYLLSNFNNVESFDLKLKSEKILSGIVDSAHAVTVADVRINNEAPIKVASKHYTKRSLHERLDRVRTEIDVMQDLREQGVFAFKPVAVSVSPPKKEDSEGEIFLLTEFDPTVITKDNHPWRRGSTPDNILTAQRVFITLGQFNTLGFRHKDAKIKNIAEQQNDGSLGLIDFETTERVDHSDPFEAAITASQDFGSMMDSLIKRGFLRDTPIEKKQEIFDNCAQAYLEFWQDSPKAIQEMVLESTSETCKAMFENIKNR